MNQNASDHSMTSFINDNYCDLPDGSDEPLTSACSHLHTRFSCLGKGCQLTTIPSSRVNDGVCDCMDGTDEWDTTYFAAHCSNRCSEATSSSNPPPAQAARKTPQHLIAHYLRAGSDDAVHKVFFPAEPSLSDRLLYELCAQIAVLFVLVLACVTFLCYKFSVLRRRPVRRKRPESEAGGL